MTDNVGARFVDARSIRVVPKGWQHPRDEGGQYIPLLPAVAYPDSPAAKRRWREEYGWWPTRKDFMPDVHGWDASRTEIMAYETTSEGTPISPPFPDTPEGRLALVEHCARHATTFGGNRTGVEGWAAILFGDAGVALDGTIHAAS